MFLSLSDNLRDFLINTDLSCDILDYIYRYVLSVFGAKIEGYWLLMGTVQLIQSSHVDKDST